VAESTRSVIGAITSRPAQFACVGLFDLRSREVPSEFDACPYACDHRLVNGYEGCVKRTISFIY
jgi:hypothetical protein